MIKEIEFPSQGATLRGLLFLPEARLGKVPLVIMAHGTSATVFMVADRYAQAFQRAGLAALLYDHRNFGRSAGEPRQEINPWIQCRGYRDAIDFAVRLAEIDPDRIALWGDSYTGGQVVVVGAIDRARQGHRRPVPGVRRRAPVSGSRPEPTSKSLRTYSRKVTSGDRPRRRQGPFRSSPSIRPARRRCSSRSRRSAGSSTTEAEQARNG